MNINNLLANLLKVIVNNECDNTPEDITDYIKSEDILDYLLNENETFLSGFLDYLKNSCDNQNFSCDGDDELYYEVLCGMLTLPRYKGKCKAFMEKYNLDIELIKKYFR